MSGEVKMGIAVSNFFYYYHYIGFHPRCETISSFLEKTSS